MNIRWVSLFLTLIGAAIVLISWFSFHNLSWVIIGAVIAAIGLLFRNSGGQNRGD